jgi:hypothetical protein
VSLSDAEIEALRKLSDAATPGPWIVEPDGCGDDGISAGGEGWRLFESSADCLADDEAFVVAARDALPRLLSALAECRRELASFRAAVEACDEDEQCRLVGHNIIPDHCGKPAHDYCSRCGEQNVVILARAAASAPKENT